jgi:hypothetical protein
MTWTFPILGGSAKLLFSRSIQDQKLSHSLNKPLPASADGALAEAAFDLVAVVAGLYVYPVKSCAGVEVR